MAGTDDSRRLDSVDAAAGNEATTGRGFATESPVGASATAGLSFSAPNISDKRLFLTVSDFLGGSSRLSSSRAVFSSFRVSESVTSAASNFFSLGGTADDSSFCCATELMAEALRPPANKLGVSAVELPAARPAPNKLGAPPVELPARLLPKKLGVSPVAMPPPNKLGPAVANLNGFGSVASELNVNEAFEDSAAVSSGPLPKVNALLAEAKLKTAGFCGCSEVSSPLSSEMGENVDFETPYQIAIYSKRHLKKAYSNP